MTFAEYLARVLIAQKGYLAGAVQEARRLEKACDIVLTRCDGYSFMVLCLVDRERNPQARFGLDIDSVKRIGRECLHYTGRVSWTKMPAFIGIMEIGGEPGERARLQRLKSSPFSKVLVCATQVDPVARTVWRNTSLRREPTRRFLRNLLDQPRLEGDDLQPPAQAAVRAEVFPALTLGLLVAMALVFACELVFGVGPTNALYAPQIRTLIAMGGLNLPLMLTTGEWHRVLSANFLHGDPFHLLLNGISLWVAGFTLERLVGRAWLGTLFFAGGVGGSLVSLAVNSPRIVSVGASGAIVCLFAAMIALSFRFPPGAEQSRLRVNALYVLLPSLLPFVALGKGISVDVAAHAGGALAGGIVGYLIVKAWPRTSPLPGHGRLATVIALGAAALYAVAAALVVLHYPAYAA